MWHSSCSSTTLDVLLYCSLSFPEQIYLGYWWWYLDADAHHQYIYVKIVWYHTQWSESRIIRLEIVGVHLNLFCTLRKRWLQVVEIFLIPGLVHLKKHQNSCNKWPLCYMCWWRILTCELTNLFACLCERLLDFVCNLNRWGSLTTFVFNLQLLK